MLKLKLAAVWGCRRRHLLEMDHHRTRDRLAPWWPWTDNQNSRYHLLLFTCYPVYDILFLDVAICQWMAILQRAVGWIHRTLLENWKNRFINEWQEEGRRRSSHRLVKELESWQSWRVNPINILREGHMPTVGAAEGISRQQRPWMQMWNLNWVCSPQCMDGRQTEQLMEVSSLLLPYASWGSS